jgi:hypothetical protein
VDVHEEACREARTKCIQTRSALKFKLYYDAAINAHEQRRADREEAVEAIADLLADSGFELSHELLDHMRTVEFMHIEVGNNYLADIDLYDDNSVQRQADTLAECVGNCLEAMYDVCEVELSSAITTDKVNRLSGYNTSIMQMFDVAGVDTKRLAERRVKLEAQIVAQVSLATQSVKAMDAEIEAQLNAMSSPAPVDVVEVKRTTQTIKSPERLAREAEETHAAEEKAAYLQAQVDKAAKAKATKQAKAKAKSLADLGTLTQS